MVIRMIAAAVGDCVHVAGLYRFVRMAESAGFDVHFMGPAVSPERLGVAVREMEPEVVALSYRLTATSGRRVLEALHRRLSAAGLVEGRVFVFGGTPPMAEEARRLGWFHRVFDGTGDDRETAEFCSRLFARLRSGEPVPPAGWHEDAAPPVALGGTGYPQTLVERVEFQRPYPIIRHHFGLPDLEATVAGVAELAGSRTLDVVSLATDQNCQEHFFHPEEMDPEQHGAGGAPVRTARDLRRIYEASRRGNFPIVRAYSGTRDILRMAKVLVETIHNGWAAIPLTWYSVLDGRSGRGLAATIREAQAAFRWHGERGIPVESNESHHWSLRDAPDAVAVAMAFLAAYNARESGVRHYVAQYMFNTPPATSPAMDLAKMLAKMDLVEGLHGPRFTTLRQARAGLASHPADPDVARGHLGASVLLQMAIRPHILHVVAFCEADHAATPKEIVESVKIARGAIRDAMLGMPDPSADPRVAARRAELVEEARTILDAIREIAAPGVDDPWRDAKTLARAVHEGLIDAPHLLGNPEAKGEIVTRIVDGSCRSVDPETYRVLDERERVRRILDGLARHSAPGLARRGV